LYQSCFYLHLHPSHPEGKESWSIGRRIGRNYCPCWLGVGGWVGVGCLTCDGSRHSPSRVILWHLHIVGMGSQQLHASLIQEFTDSPYVSMMRGFADSLYCLCGESPGENFWGVNSANRW
jgi:hypothetical protein